MGLLKDLFSEHFYKNLTDSLVQVVPGFDTAGFIQHIYTPAFQQMELKQRMRHTTQVLHDSLAMDYPDSVNVLGRLIQQLRGLQTGEGQLAYIFLPDYIECYGLEHLDTSLKAIENITQFITCEFAVRPFLAKYGPELMLQMQSWSLHENPHVRRLASEGSRPALPWATAVPYLKKDPTPILPILENLKYDPSEYVRRSVANNLNDISKYHPEVVLEIARNWKGLSKETDAIIKHGCRTLLKRGDHRILDHYGLDGKDIALENLQILSPIVKIGDALEFAFTLKNTAPGKRILRLEYAIYYKMQNGMSRKVFKISEREYEAGQQVVVTRKQSFRIITTRKFYAGIHQLSVIVNGAESERLDFTLIDG
jgi:3-methyladenine DNA glycosylase AlkC